LQGAGDFENGAELFEIGGSGAAGIGTDGFLEELFDLIAIAGEVKLIAIGNTELDAVGGVERAGFDDALTVDPEAVAAVEIFQDTLAVVVIDLGVVARDAAVAKDEVVIGRAADAEGEGMERDAGAAAVGVDDDERGIGGCRVG
jgi:hypothetical protein